MPSYAIKIKFAINYILEYNIIMEYEDKKFNPTKIIVFILIGGALVILSDLFIFGGIKNISHNNGNESLVDVASLKKQHSLYMDEGVYIDPSILAKAMPPIVKPTRDAAMNDVANNDKENQITIDEILANQKAMELADIMPAIGTDKNIYKNIDENTDIALDDEFKNILSEINIEPAAPDIDVSAITTYEYDEPKGNGMIAIIIDDMGISLRSKLVEILPAPLTLSYLPYANNLKQRTERAAKNGHELMVHMPMEPMSDYVDDGPKVLKSSQNEADFIDTLDWGLSQFDGFVGVNNHMGSKITQDKNAMNRVMNYLKARDEKLFFIDSKTIGSSVAASSARNVGIPYAVRDVFLDHEISKEFIEKSLKKLEDIASKKGYAIAIGHPHKETIAALKAWLPTLKSKGLTLVPASKLIKQPKPANDDLVAGR